jgi:hypothetical protein
MGLERGPLSLVSTTEELLKRKGSSSGLESRDYCCKDPQRWPLDASLSAKVGNTSPPSCRSVGIVSSRTKATELSTQRYSQSSRQNVSLRNCRFWDLNIMYCIMKLCAVTENQWQRVIEGSSQHSHSSRGRMPSNSHTSLPLEEEAPFQNTKNRVGN